jgi:hypothetical protein
MRHAIAMALAVFVSCPMAAGAQSRTVEKTLQLEPGGNLSITATKGSLRLTAWDRSEVEVRARIEATDRMRDEDYARRAVEAATVDITGGGASVTIRSDYSDVPSERSYWGGDSRTLPDIHYEIRAPKKVQLYLDVDRTNSHVGGFDGRLRIEADRSELDVRTISGELRVEIDRGGRSRFENITGSFVLDGDRTDVDIAVAKLTDRARLELDRGDAEIRVPAGQPITLRTDIERRGSFRSDLPLQAAGGDDHSPEGTINGGGPVLTVIAHRARVELRER